MRQATTIISALWALFLCANADARSLLHSSGGASQTQAAFIAAISPTSASILDNVAAGTTIAKVQCFMNTGASCPPTVVWALSGPHPSFVDLSATQSDGSVLLRAIFTPSSAADGPPSFNSNTFDIIATLGSTVPVVASISPTALTIPQGAAQQTPFQFTCVMSDGSSCSGRTWSFANYPFFLTPGSNATGGTLTTNQVPPLPISSGTLSVTAQ